MKTKFSLSIVACLLLFMSFQTSAEKNVGTVDQKEGLYVYMLCKPSAATEYLGSVKKNLAFSGKPQEMLNSMIRKVKKEFPQAEAIVFTDVEMDQADAVKFK